MRSRSICETARHSLRPWRHVPTEDLLPLLLSTLWARPARDCTFRSSRALSTRRIGAQPAASGDTLQSIKQERKIHNGSLSRPPAQHPTSQPKTQRKRVHPRPDLYHLSGRRDEYGMLDERHGPGSPEQSIPDPPDHKLTDTTSAPPNSSVPDSVSKGSTTDLVKDKTTSKTPASPRGFIVDSIRKPYSIPDPDRYAGKSARKLRRMAVTERHHVATPYAQSATRPLLLTIDAFDTIFTPKDPIPAQYAAVAARHGIKAQIADISADFRAAFKQFAATHPNYGKATGLTPKRWWSSIINDTFPSHRYPKMTPDTRVALGDDLYKRFSSKAGYRLFPDVEPFLQQLGTCFQASSWAPRRTMLGILSNSDPRVLPILKSFQIHVKPAMYPPRFAPQNRYQRGPDFGPARPAFATLSYNAGVEKPDPAIFERALTDAQNALMSIHTVGRLTRTAHDVLNNILTDFHHMHVGDSLKKDVMPAIKAGWDGVWLDRSSDVAIREVLVNDQGDVQLDPAPWQAGSIVRWHGYSTIRESSTVQLQGQSLHRITAINALTALASVITKQRLEGAYVDVANVNGATSQAKAGLSNVAISVEPQLRWIESRHSQIQKVADSTPPATTRRARRRGLGAELKPASSSNVETIINRWGREETRRLVEID